MISGKGGTGKTSLTACLAALSDRVLLADADVDAPDLHLLLEPHVEQAEPFTGSQVAVVTEQLCIGCGRCVGPCRFGAMSPRSADSRAGWVAIVDELTCDGCGLCVEICPAGAIRMEPRVTGERYESRTRFGTMIHARLRAGQGNSGLLVATVRNRAREVAARTGAELIITDGPPGIGCPVIAAIGGADLALIVVEPTVASLHDLRRVGELTRHFKVPAGVCVNRCDLNDKLAEAVGHEATLHGMPILGRIPYDETFTGGQLAGLSLVEHVPDSPTSVAVRGLHQRVMKHLVSDVADESTLEPESSRAN